MRWELLPNRLCIVLALCGGIAIGALASPVWRLVIAAYYEGEYGRLVYKCDNAMREHMITKQLVVRNPSESAVRSLRQAELGLLACQDYDLLRKRLITLGLTDNELAQLGLRAIEERAVSLQRVVQTHEIRF